MSTSPEKIRVGISAIGLDTCWAQFDGLLDKLAALLGMKIVRVC
jgi:hypothetical protein